jgi:DNA-binding transcriptional LysR family regulator
VPPEYDKHRENELTVLSTANNTEAQKNLEPIRIFMTVAEMGSFTHAADSLGIQKGKASTAVRKLEEDVGVRLLHRTTRSVQLTEDGRVFHARARDLLLTLMICTQCSQAIE